MTTRHRVGSKRFMAVRVGLFFLAAGIWFAGVMTENDWITGIALAIGMAGLVLGFIARSRDAKAEGEEEPV
jgi:hypothetical protein